MHKFKNMVMESGTVVKLLSLVGALMIFLYTTFATINYVDARHKERVDLLQSIADDVSLVKRCIINQQCEH